MRDERGVGFLIAACVITGTAGGWVIAKWDDGATSKPRASVEIPARHIVITPEPDRPCVIDLSRMPASDNLIVECGERRSEQ